MMTPEAKFIHALEIFGREIFEAIQYFYTLRTINTLFSENKDLLNAVNSTPLFWNTNTSALQTAFFIVLGRIFEPKKQSKYNLDRLLSLAEKHRDIFSKKALADRKKKDSANADQWLDDYLKSVYEPLDVDFRRLRRHEEKYKTIYHKNYRDIRRKYYAHKEKVKTEDVEALFSKTNVHELEKLLVSLNKLYKALWVMLYNGHKPILRAMPYSVKAITSRRMAEWPEYYSNSNEIQVHAVEQTKKFFATFMLHAR